MTDEQIERVLELAEEFKASLYEDYVFDGEEEYPSYALTDEAHEKLLRLFGVLRLWHEVRVFDWKQAGQPEGGPHAPISTTRGLPALPLEDVALFGLPLPPEPEGLWGEK